jgi:signal transduction histidine kinase
MLLAIFLALALAQFFTRPFRHLNQDARQMSRGDFTAVFRKEGPLEARELAETLQTAQTEFAATEQLRRDFIANISHDMKTPLTVIRAYAELIDSFSGDIPEKRAAHIDQILKETDHLNNLINDMLELAKLQSGTIQLDWNWFSLNDLIEETFERLQLRHDGEMLEFTYDAAADYQVHGDRRLLARALYNLMNNAVKYSPERKQIDVRAVPSGGKLRIEIRDHGIGISEEDLPSVWNRFYRAPSRSEEITGSGMGLNIASEIFKSHHSKYGAKSRLGEGSTFWFVLTYKE